MVDGPGWIRTTDRRIVSGDLVADPLALVIGG